LSSPLRPGAIAGGAEAVQTRAMGTSVRYAAALALALALPAGAFAAPPALPNALDASGAYNEWHAEPCRRLIDQCEDYVSPTGAEQVSGLSCRRLGPDRARCRFTVADGAGYRCRALLRDVTGTYGRSWVAERSRRDGVPYALRVRCREAGRRGQSDRLSPELSATPAGAVGW